MNFEVPQAEKKMIDGFVQKFLDDLKNHDRKTFEHSVEVGQIAAYLIKELGSYFSEKEQIVFLRAALLHDYGKTGIAAEILNKESDLTQEERKVIQMHPKIGFDVLKDWNMEIAKVVVAHHEHQEHSYPREYMREDTWKERFCDVQTRKLSRILAMIDAFQAMLADRPGKNNKPKTIDQSLGELGKRFILPEDQEIIFLLEKYYRQKNPNQPVNYESYIHLVGQS